MQQTQKYKLNLIERDDPFLPDALNQNTQKVEDVLKGMEDGPLAEMDGRVTALEAHRYFVGSYIGNGVTPRFIDLGFTPVAVCLAAGSSGGNMNWAFTGAAASAGAVAVVEGGFQVSNPVMGSLNSAGYTYPFLVFV